MASKYMSPTTLAAFRCDSSIVIVILFLRVRIDSGFPLRAGLLLPSLTFTSITRSNVSAILLQHGRAPQTWCALRAARSRGCRGQWLHLGTLDQKPQRDRDLSEENGRGDANGHILV